LNKYSSSETVSFGVQISSLCRGSEGLTLANLAAIQKQLRTVIKGRNIPIMARKVVFRNEGFEYRL
jgi:hypothetical protein